MYFFTNLLKLFQIISVIMIPIAVIKYYWEDVHFCNFIGGFNQIFISFFSNFTSMTIGGNDFTLVFLVLPWVIFVIITGSLINFIDSLSYKVDEVYSNIKTQKVTALTEQKKKIHLEELQKKHAVYLVIELVFSKFTISNLTDSEIEEKKEEVKESLFKDVISFRGNLIEDDEFENENTVALLFFSQDDALNFIFKFKEVISIVDDDIQNFGYSINFKAILDSQTTEAIRFYILQFLEKALKTVEINEISTTNDFAERYKAYGGMKHIDFHSKGTYSINKSRVELNSLIY